MAPPSLQSVRRTVDAVLSEYDANFAGQSRVTRDIAQIDRLIGRLRAARAEAEGLPRSVNAAEVTSLRDSVRTALEMYEAEKKLIVQAKALGPDYADFAALGGDANLVFAVYHRHFAGKNRATRDLGLLAEMVEDLGRIQEAMTDLVDTLPAHTNARADVDLVKENTRLYVAERGEIVEARGVGAPADQSGILGEVANGQFRVYEAHFAGRSRVTRRPALLQRVIDNLAHVHDRMQVLKDQGLSVDYHERNLGIVAAALVQYRTELAEIRKVRESTPLVDIMGSLGAAANEVMEEYGKSYEGQDRKTRDLDLLSNLCDRMAEIGRQMADLDRAEANEMNARNLGIVISNRVMLEREYTLIEQARGQRVANLA